MKYERVIYFKHSLHQLLYLSIILVYNKNTHTQTWFEENVLRGSLRSTQFVKKANACLQILKGKKFYLGGLSLRWNTKKSLLMLYVREFLSNIGNFF